MNLLRMQNYLPMHFSNISHIYSLLLLSSSKIAAGIDDLDNIVILTTGELQAMDRYTGVRAATCSQFLNNHSERKKTDVVT
jgi:hypothetical protein